jgi:histidyl-tRNA synthetase
VLALRAAEAEVPRPDIAEVYVARTAPELSGETFALAQLLRRAEIATEMDHQNRSLKAQMKAADKLGASFVVLVGQDELAEGQVTLRDMSTKEELRVGLEELVDVLYEALADSYIDEDAEALSGNGEFDKA